VFKLESRDFLRNNEDDGDEGFHGKPTVTKKTKVEVNRFIQGVFVSTNVSNRGSS